MGDETLRVARIALTGATGAVGAAVRQLLEQLGCRPVIVGRHEDVSVRWDLEEPLSAEAARALRTADLVIHCAADVRLDKRNEVVQRINTEAVGELVSALTAAPLPPRLVHVSTAFVDTGDEGFHNPYELSKHRAEQIVTGSGLHGAIVRPSLVIGRTSDGSIPRFSGIYTLVRLAIKGMVPAMPVPPDLLIDLVPVDLVAEVIVDAARTSLDPSHRGMPVRVAASGRAAPTVQTMFDIGHDAASRRLGQTFPTPPLVDPEAYHRLFRPLMMPELSGGQRMLIEALEVFLPYFTADHAFDDTVLRLEPEQVADTWRRSVDHWLDVTKTRPVTNSRAWSPRATAVSG